MDDSLFWLHLLILIASSFFLFSIFNPKNIFLDSVVFTYLISWANLIITAIILSFFGSLNNLYFYVTLSILLNLLLISISIYFHGIKFQKFHFGKPSLKSFFGHPLFASILVTVFIFQLIICFNYLPSIPDTMSSKLTKIYAYLEHGKLLPNKNFDSSLLFGAPLNTAATWLFFVVHEVSLKALHFFSLWNWIIIGSSAYLLCRKLKISKNSSIFAVTLFLCSEILVLNSTADSDDILVTSSFLISILSFIYWYFDRQKFYILLSGIAFGINFGLKPFAVFYYILILLIFGILCFQYRFKEQVQFLRKYLLDFFLFVVGFIFLFSGVLYENYTERGNPIKFNSVISNLQNKPFDTKTAGINLFSQNFTLFAGPILVPTGMNNRNSLVNKANDIARNLVDQIFSTTQEEIYQKYSAQTEKTTVTSDIYYDHTAFFGFYPHLVIISLFLCIFIPRKNYIIFLLGSSFLFALWAYCIHVKYVAGILRYWIMFFAITVPVLGYTLETRFNSRSKILPGFVNLIFYPVLLYTIFACFYANFNSYYRSISAILNHQNFNSYEKDFDPNFVYILKNIKRANIIYHHNFPNSIFHILGYPNSQFISKYDIVDSLPNILIPYPLNLGNLYPVGRYIDVAVDEKFPRNFVHVSTSGNYKYFINNLPSSLVQPNQKYSFIFSTTAPIMIDSKIGFYLNLYSNLGDAKDYEFSVLVQNKESKETLIKSFQEITKTNVLISIDPSDKFLIIRLRNKKSGKLFENKYPI